MHEAAIRRLIPRERAEAAGRSLAFVRSILPGTVGWAEGNAAPHGALGRELTRCPAQGRCRQSWGNDKGWAAVIVFRDGSASQGDAQTCGASDLSDAWAVQTPSQRFLLA